MRQMRLSERHVALVTEEMPDLGYQSVGGSRAATEEDYKAAVRNILAGAPKDGFWFFAYGSLIWKPACDFVDMRVALARPWHRRFCLGWSHRHRGSPERPGLMLALDRGGQCRGVCYRIADDALEENLDKLVRREMGSVPSAFPPRWINVETPLGPLRAMTFAMDRKSPRYVAGLSDDEIADVLATACGNRGSMAEYLFQTVQHLEALNIHDRHLWKLQEMVAQRIERNCGC